MSTFNEPPTPPQRKISILFVCLGNICRSPMAEAVFRSLVTTPLTSSFPTTTNTQTPSSTNTTPEYVIDSAGTAAYHTDSPPDPRTMHTLKKNGIEGYKHLARKVRERDFWEVDWIFAMDGENLRDLERMRARAEKKGIESGEEGAKLARVRLFGDFGGQVGEEVVDPYYGEGEGFEIAFEQMGKFGRGFLREVEEVDGIVGR